MNNYQNYSMDEIIFENRNKAYGAYQLRQIIDRNAAYGLLATTSAIVVFTLIALFMPHSAGPPLPTVVNSETSNILEILQPPPVIPKSISSPKSIAPPPSQTFTEMTPVVETPATTTEPAKQADLANSTAVVSTVTNTVTETTASLSTTTTVASITSTATTEAPVKPAIIKWAEVMPSFVGGNEALAKYLKNHIFMDSHDIDIGLSGRVIIQFYIDIDGSVKDAKVLKDEAGGSCAERALTAINNMPKWNPGKQGDKPVRVYHVIPISFKVMQ